jgi:hypothetical protein
MSNAWRVIRDAALRPIFPVAEIERYLTEQALMLTAERIAERAYLRELIEGEFGE